MRYQSSPVIPEERQETTRERAARQHRERQEELRYTASDEKRWAENRERARFELDWKHYPIDPNFKKELIIGCGKIFRDDQVIEHNHSKEQITIDIDPLIAPDYVMDIEKMTNSEILKLTSSGYFTHIYLENIIIINSNVAINLSRLLNKSGGVIYYVGELDDGHMREIEEVFNVICFKAEFCKREEEKKVINELLPSFFAEMKAFKVIKITHVGLPSFKETFLG
ncbi:hypothetical protein [uncultured Vibrio sp.]|uniref:hypothetical protein n=1 Tax=uncultured Vibrio sp. TaxID=114054 RepID=UPI002638FDC7|nr:hypothetical protein [uncultured Vibrio sp.]